MLVRHYWVFRQSSSAYGTAAVTMPLLLAYSLEIPPGPDLETSMKDDQPCVACQSQDRIVIFES